MRVDDLLDGFSGGESLQNRLDGNARACYDGLAHHHAGRSQPCCGSRSRVPLETSVPRRACESHPGRCTGAPLPAEARWQGALRAIFDAPDRSRGGPPVGNRGAQIRENRANAGDLVGGQRTRQPWRAGSRGPRPSRGLSGRTYSGVVWTATKLLLSLVFVPCSNV